MPTPSSSRPEPPSPEEAAPAVRKLLRTFLGPGVETARWKPSTTPTELVSAAARFRVLPHVRSALKAADVPSLWREEAEQLLLPVMQRRTAAAMMLCRHAAAALRCLDAAGVSVIPFKGPFLSADVYGDSFFRPGADIDLLLVRGRADIERASSALRGIGYVEPDIAPEVREYHHTSKGQLGLVGKRRPPLDLHYALYDDLPARAIAEASARAIAVTDEGPHRLRFAFVDLLMILAVHYWRHPGASGMLPLVDLAMVLRDPRAFPDGWLDIVRSWRMALYIAAGMEAVRHEFGVSVAGEAPELLRATLPRKARALCERIRRDGPGSLPFGLVQGFHRLGLPWRERLRAVRRYVWPHPGKLAEETKDGKGPRGRLARLVGVGRRLLKAVRRR